MKNQIPQFKSGITSLSRIFYVLLGAAILWYSLFYVHCSSQSNQDKSNAVRVGLVFDAAGKDDKSFNSAAWKGASQAEKEFSIILKDVEPGAVSAIEPAIQTLAEMQFDIIIGVGFAATPAIKKVSEKYPSRYFGIVDVPLEKPNVAAMVFEEQEGAFMVGYIAAKCSKTGIVGFVGGMDIPLIHRFSVAYKAGAEYANPSVKVVINYAGITPAAWADPTKGKELALAQYAQGADVIFAAAGATGLGVFDAAEEKKKLVIGCDSNQNWLKPGYVLTSMLKRVDVAVYSLIRDVIQKEFHPGIHRFDLKNNGVDFAVDQYNQNLLSPAVIEQANKLKNDIINGLIHVPDYYDSLAATR